MAGAQRATDNRSAGTVTSEARAIGAAAVVVSGAATLLFVYFAYYFWFEVEPSEVTAGLLWLVVALSAPVAALLARRVGMRRGQRGPALLTRMGATALVSTCAALCLYFALYVLAVSLL